MLENLLSQIHERIGKRISAIDLELSEDLDDKLEKRIVYIESLKRGKMPQRLRASLERQMELIEVVLYSDENGLPLTYVDLMGVMALKHGFTKEKLFPYAKAFAAMAASGFIVNGGEIPDVRRSLQIDLVNKVNEIIQGSESALSSIDIAEMLGNRSRHYINMVNYSFNLLEIIGEVVRLPTDSRRYGGPYMWIASNYRKTKETIPEWNFKYAVLLALRDRGKSTQYGLTNDNRVRTTASIKEAFGYRGMDIHDRMNDLIIAGLVRCVVKKVRGLKASRGSTVYSITKEALRLLKQTEQDGYLNEDLRKALIGEKYIGLKTSEELALARIKRVATLYISRRPDEGTYRLATRIGENGSYAAAIFSGHDPLRFFKEETLRSKFSQYLTPSENRGLEIYLKTRKSDN